MNLEALRRLQQAWRADTLLQCDLEVALDAVGFDAQYVEDCIESAASGRASRKTKYIKDNIWGMIAADWRLIRLLDSPVVQRLRQIKQLGLSYLTYPSAEHTRFIHSLGMSAVVTQFLDSANARAAEVNDFPEVNFLTVSQLAPIKRDDIIHAALLHDIGHMPFSHATEFALAGQPTLFTCGHLSVEEFTDNVGRFIRKEISLSEALSLLVVLSNRFQRFYSEYVRRGDEDTDALLRIGCLIAGVPPTPRLSGVTDLISSAAIDADKIDYISRDAKACGVPIGVDDARIFLRSAFIEVDKEHLEAWRLKTDPADKEALFIVNASGVDTLDEITQARAALYQRVYLHAVTRTAESMLARGLEANARSPAQTRNPRLADALRLWACSDDAVLCQLAESGDATTRSYGLCLKLRKLPKKACAFSASISDMHMPLKEMFKKISRAEAESLRKLVVNTPLEGLDVKELVNGRSREIEQRIRLETALLAQKLTDNYYADLVPDSPLADLVLVGAAYMDRARKEAIVLQNGELLQTSEFTNVRETQDALEIFKSVGFVMSDPEWSPIVAVAARTVLAEPKSVVMPAALPSSIGGAEISIQERMILDIKGMARRSGVQREKLDRIMTAAAGCGYFDRHPHLAARWEPSDTSVREVADLLAGFDGEGSWRVNNFTVAAFLNQFPPSLREQMVAMLKKIVFFDATAINTAILPRIKALASAGAVDVVGISPSSGSAVSTILDRTLKASPDSNINLCRELREALSVETDRPLALVDDNASSGIQITAQFLSWLGEERSSWPAECRQEENLFMTPLASESIERLKRRPIHILLCAGKAAAEERLSEILADRGFTQFNGLSFAHDIQMEFDWPVALKDYLSAVGTSLLAWCRHKKDPDELTGPERLECAEKSFGYENAGGLTATSTNVPTSTVTPLWSPGIYRGNPWMPLLIRQNKLRHLVVA
jgi:deoxynucleoside triphosphate triphosphohydrolase SAMHD1